jgi:hypothetical protein
MEMMNAPSAQRDRPGSEFLLLFDADTWRLFFLTKKRIFPHFLHQRYPEHPTPPQQLRRIFFNYLPYSQSMLCCSS